MILKIFCVVCLNFLLFFFVKNARSFFGQSKIKKYTKEQKNDKRRGVFVVKEED